MLLLEVPEWVNREVLDFVGSMTAPAEVSSSRAIEGNANARSFSGSSAGFAAVRHG
jgi:hypothetical protein